MNNDPQLLVLRGRVNMSSTRKLLLYHLLLQFIANSHIYRQVIKSGTRKSVCDSSEYGDGRNENRFNFELDMKIGLLDGGHLGKWNAAGTVVIKRRYHRSRISRYSNKSSTVSLQLLKDCTIIQILTCGDVHPHPGPTTVKDPCSVCKKSVKGKHKAVSCDICLLWCHIKCGSISNAEYNTMINTTNLYWECPICRDAGDRRSTPSLYRREQTTEGNSSDYLTSLKNNLQNRNKNFINIAHINIDGLIGKFNEIQLLLQEVQFDIFAITETHLSKDIHDGNIHVNGYRFVRRDRNEQDDGWNNKIKVNYGGCIIYFKEYLNIIPVQEMFEGKIESLWIEITQHSQKLLVGNIYRRPKDSNFYDKLREVLEKVCNKRTNVVIVGDLNSDLLNDTEPQQKSTGKKLSRILNSFSLKNVIKTSTRITRTSESLIDIMITKSKEKVIETDVVHCGISDHSLVYGIYKIKKEKELPRIKIVKEFSKVDFNKLNWELEQVPWSVCSAFDDVNDSLWAYNNLYQNVAKDYIPERKVKVRHKSLPWINSEIRKLMNQRFAALNKYKRTKNGSDWNAYKKLRNKVTKQLKIGLAEYWKKSFKEAKNVKSFGPW